MVAELYLIQRFLLVRCSLAKISMVAERLGSMVVKPIGCSLAKISMVAEQQIFHKPYLKRCSLAKISMVAEPR